MRFIILVVLIALAPITVSGANLDRSDLNGEWVTPWRQVDGEVQRLVVSLDGESIFERRFTNAEAQVHTTSEHLLVDDLLILVFGEDGARSQYKLVLSGWKTSGTTRLYGAMFMYRNGVQFNMMLVAFDKNEDAA